MTTLTWIAIVRCLCQSAMRSGLHLALFTIGRLGLRLEVAKNNWYALRVLAVRQNPQFLLVTILWGNVAVNVLLALLSGSVLTGVGAFLSSTVVITLFGAERFNPFWCCHRPIIVRNGRTTIGEIIPALKVKPDHSQDDVADHDGILLWGRKNGLSRAAMSSVGCYGGSSAIRRWMPPDPANGAVTAGWAAISWPLWANPADQPYRQEGRLAPWTDSPWKN